MHPIASKYQNDINPILKLKKEIAEIEASIKLIEYNGIGKIRTPYLRTIDYKKRLIKKIRGKILKLEMLNNETFGQ